MTAPLLAAGPSRSAAALRVERYEGTAEEWDAFVRAQRGATHAHLHGWKTVVERVFGHECVYLVARGGAGEIAGVLPLVRVRSVPFGHYLVSMPFLNYGGPIGSDDAVRALAANAAELSEVDRVKLLELRSRVPLRLDLPVSHRKITVVLDLPDTPEALMKRFDAKLRSQVRRPQKEGVTVAFGADRVDDFHAVFSHHMRDLGTPTLPRAFFRALADTFPDDAWFAVAYLGGQPVAAGCGFRFRDEFEMTWASSLRAFNRASPNMLLYWACMERGIREQLARFNFGRCSPGGGTHRFKLQWGSRDEPLWWYAATRAGAPATTPSPDDSAYSWGPRVWKHLPLAVANVLGPQIVKFIP